MKLLLTICLLLWASVSSFAQLKWERFTAYDNSFSILFPDPPQRKTTKDKKAGIKQQLYMTGLLKDKYYFIAGTTDHKDTTSINDTTVLKANRENFCKTAKLQLIQCKDINYLNKYKGIEFTCKNEKTFFKCNVYVINKRIYMLVAGADQSCTEIEKFLSSFKLLKKD